MSEDTWRLIGAVVYPTIVAAIDRTVRARWLREANIYTVGPDLCFLGIGLCIVVAVDEHLRSLVKAEIGATGETAWSVALIGGVALFGLLAGISYYCAGTAKRLDIQQSAHLLAPFAMKVLSITSGIVVAGTPWFLAIRPSL